MTSAVLPALVTMVCAYLGGAVAALALAARGSGRLGSRVGHGAAVLGALAGVVAGVSALAAPAGAAPLLVELPVLFPFARLLLAVDGLSGFFLLVISVVSAAAALYAPAYLAGHAEHEHEHDRGHGHGSEAVARDQHRSPYEPADSASRRLRRRD